VLLGGFFTAMGYPRPGTAYATTEPAAVPRAGVALVRGLPEPPANVSASPRDGGATITFGPSPYNGGAAITTYTVTAQPGNISVSGTASPILVAGLTNGQAYTFTATATNSAGTGTPSAASNPVTPARSVRSAPPSPPAEQPRPDVPAPPPSTTRIPPSHH
jgi:hypothetical protein